MRVREIEYGLSIQAFRMPDAVDLCERCCEEKCFCASGREISNPVLANLGANLEQQLYTGVKSALPYSSVEQIFFEFMLSACGQQGASWTLCPVCRWQRRSGIREQTGKGTLVLIPGSVAAETKNVTVTGYQWKRVKISAKCSAH